MATYQPKKLSEYPVNTSPSNGDLVPSLVADGSGSWVNRNIPYSSLKGEKGEPGAGLISGGSTNQALVKSSNSDFATKWQTIDKTFVGLSSVDNTSDANKPVSTAVQDAITAAVAQAKKDQYPVGSTYFNKTNPTNPATLLGFGTWARLEGVVLGGRSETGGSPFNVSAGTIIGADTHTLTEAQIPSHRHTIPTPYGIIVGSTGGSGLAAGTGVGEDYAAKDTTYTGGGGSHNNIQRTLVGYLWERTA